MQEAGSHYALRIRLADFQTSLQLGRIFVGVQTSLTVVVRKSSEPLKSYLLNLIRPSTLNLVKR